MSPLEKYAQIIIHSGCTTPPIGEMETRPHKWEECRAQKFYLKIAAKQQHKLKSNGLAIGTWVKLKDKDAYAPVSQLVEESDSNSE